MELLRIKDLIINPAYTIKANASISDAAKILEEKDCKILIITKNEKPIGTITERDIIKKVSLNCFNPKQIKVQQLISKPLFFGTPEMRLSEAAKIMLYKKIDFLPIIFKNRLIGIINLSDIFQNNDSIKQFKGFAESATSTEMKQAIDVYFTLENLCKKCPLMIEQGYPKKCRKSECMWWIGEDCAVSIISKTIINKTKTIPVKNY